MENDFTVLFDNFDLNSIPYVYFVRRYPNNESGIKINSYDLVRRDGALITSVRHDKKKIALEGYIIAPSRTSYEEAMDLFKLRTSGIEKPLVLSQAGSGRRYLATKDNLIEEHISDGKSRISLSFVVSKSYGEDIQLTSWSNTVTTSPYAIDHIFGGTAIQKPQFTVIVNSLTAAPSDYIGIGNSTSGQVVSVSRTWTVGDEIIFNTDTEKVYVNGVLTVYDGVFPSFSPLEANAYYVDSFSARNATIGMVYAKRYS